MDSEGERAPVTSSAALRVPVPAVGALLLGALVLLLSIPTLASLHALWVEDQNYSHGYLVLGLTAFFVVRELRREPLRRFEPSMAGLAGFVVLTLVVTAAHASSILLVMHLAMPALWLAAIWALAPASNARRLVLPIGFLYFATAIWDLAIEPLQRLTVAVVSAGIRAVDVPAFIEGNLIHVPSGSFEVAAGCSGLRYAVVAATLGAFVSLYHRRRWTVTFLVATGALLLALAANWLRVFVIVLVGHFTDMQHYLIVNEHDSFGWVVFLLCMTPLLYVNRKLRGEGGVPRRAVCAAPSVARGSRAAVAYSVGVVAALGVWLNYRVDHAADPVGAARALEAPEVPGWQRADEWLDARRPEFVGATSDVAHWYEDGRARVGVYVVHYARQDQAREIVFAENRPEGEAGSAVARRPVVVALPLGRAIRFEEIEIVDSTDQRRLVWLVLRVAGETTTSHVAAKMWQIVGTIRGRRDAQALVLTSVCGDECNDARAALSRYAAAATRLLLEQVDRVALPEGVIAFNGAGA